MATAKKEVALTTHNPDEYIPIGIDRNIMLNGDCFDQYGTFENTVRNLTIYTAFSFQKDLFGYGKIDRRKFEAEMKIGRSTLETKVKFKDLIKKGEITEKEVKEEIDYFGTDNIDQLEHSLYLMVTKPLILRTKGQTKVGRDWSSIHNITLLDSFHIEVDKSNKRGKKIYMYTCKDDNLKNMVGHFSLVLLQAYTSCPDSFRGFYLFLRNQKAILEKDNTQPSLSPEFDLLARKLRRSTDTNERSRKAKYVIVKALETISEIDPFLGLKMAWKGYKLILTQDSSVPTLPKQQLEKVERLYLLQMKDHYLSKVQKNLSIDELADGFNDWVNNKKLDHFVKFQAYKTLISEHYDEKRASAIIDKFFEKKFIA